MDKASGQLAIILSLVMALWLSIVHLPDWAQAGRPELVAMVTVYWIVAVPGRVGIGCAWLVGLLQDIVEGTTLGQHAFALSIVAYLALNLYQRLRMFTTIQQAGVVFVFIGLNQLLCHWVQSLSGEGAQDLMFLLPALISALLWPLLAVFLHLIRRVYFVS
jgi:rod shape-determining protein MreD